MFFFGASVVDCITTSSTEGVGLGFEWWMMEVVPQWGYGGFFSSLSSLI